MSHDEAWRRTLARLRLDLGEEVFSSWFGRLELDSVAYGVACMSVPTRFLRSWIDERYATRVLNALNAEIGGVTRVQFTVRSLTRPAPEQDRQPVEAPGFVERSDKPAPTAIVRGQPTPLPAPLALSWSTEFDDAAGSPLDRRMTFDAFFVGSSNQQAHSAARRVVESVGEPTLDQGPTYIYAPAGLGKTHLLQAIAQSVHGEGRRVAYLNATRFMRDFIGALKTARVGLFQNALRSVDLLIIDNAQLLQGKCIQQEFGDSISFMINVGRRVVIAADRPPSDLENIDEPIRLCLAKGSCVTIEAPEESLRLRILEARAAAARRTCPSFSLSQVVLEHVAKTVDTNGRDLEEVVNHLLEQTKSSGLQHTVESAGRAIQEMSHVHDHKRVKIEDIQNLVASHYSMTREDLLSAQKTAELVKPRQIAMYLSKALTLRSLPEIGRRFGGRDHTTVLYAVRKIESLARADRALSDEIRLFKHALARIGFVSSDFLSPDSMSKNGAAA